MNPKRNEDIQIQDLPDGSALLYDTESATAFPINESAAVAWRACDGEHSTAEIADEIEARFEADRETIFADLGKLFDDLQSRGLLQAQQAE